MAATGSDQDTGSSDRAGGADELGHLRQRAGLYLLVMLVIDLAAHLSDWITPLFTDYPAVTLGPQATIVRFAVTFVLAGAWLAVRFAKLGLRAIGALEAGVTISLSYVYVVLAGASPFADGTVGTTFALLGIVLLLFVRAALVPSPLSRTLVVGIASGAIFLADAFSNPNIDDPIVHDGFSFMTLAFVAASSVTSHVIYGLRRQVRDAVRLGQYTLEEKLGEGGMGAVYRARHAMLRRRAAIKLIRPELVEASENRSRAVARFEREAQATADLKSPHTVQLYDFGIASDGAFYYVMELLDGINLEHAVERYGPMPPERVVHILRQACASLAEAHAAGLVHRDIKPANLFLCRYGLQHDVVKVLDFGLVALGPQGRRDGQSKTGEGIAGTPAYLPPEIATGETEVDGRADLYALGCVAYYLLSGRLPFVRGTPLATILAHVKDAPEPPSAVSELPIPAELEALVLACMAKDPEERPASAADLDAALGALSLEAQASDERASDGRGTVARWDEARAAAWWSEHLPLQVTAGTTDGLPSGASAHTFDGSPSSTSRSGRAEGEPVAVTVTRAAG